MILRRSLGANAAFVAPFILFIALMALSGLVPDGQIWGNGFDNRWLYGIRIALVGTAVAYLWRFYGELHAPYHLRLNQVAASIVIGACVFWFWIRLDFGWLRLGDADGFRPLDGDGTIIWAIVVPRLIGAAILVPVIEELFWRSFLMRWLENPAFQSVVPQRITVRSLFLSSGLFALEHHLWFAGFLAGVVYGWMYMRSGNLWYSIIAHAATNAILGVWVLQTGNWQFW